MDNPKFCSRRNALAPNLPINTYGSIAQTGGGQEVARILTRRHENSVPTDFGYPHSTRSASTRVAAAAAIWAIFRLKSAGCAVYSRSRLQEFAADFMHLIEFD